MERLQGVQNGWRSALSNPLRFFQRQKYLLRQSKLPASEATKTCTQGLLPHKKKKPHENFLEGFKAKKMSLVMHRTFRPARHVERLQGVQMGAALLPLLFFKDKLSAHKKPILKHTSSLTNLLCSSSSFTWHPACCWGRGCKIQNAYEARSRPSFRARAVSNWS